jgi:CRP-like cAMP-binding protein
VQREELPAGALLFQQGDPGDRFFSIVEGQVEIFVEEPSGLRRRVAVLQQGDCFGELALIERAPRSAGARTLGRTVVLSLHQDAFSALSTEVGAGLTGRLRAIAAINRNELFRGLTAERVGALASRLTTQGVPAGQAVVQEGAVGREMYLVDSGELEVVAPGATTPLATLTSGDLFGEVAVLRAVPRTATVRAKVASSLWVLSAEDFYQLLGKDLPWMSAMESHASRRLRG